MTRTTFRYWFDHALIAAFYGTILFWAYGFYTTPGNPTGRPCGGSIGNHWQWGGTPEHIVPVCLSRPQSARQQ